MLRKVEGEGQSKKGRPKRIWKKQVGEKKERKNAVCQSERIVGVN